MRLLNRLILRMQSTNAHRCAYPRQPQGIPNPYVTRQRRPGHHQARTLHGKGAVDSQTKALMLRVLAGGQLTQMLAQRFNTNIRRRRRFK